MKRECETCIKRKTLYCPSTNECMNTDDMPYYQNRFMLLEENKKLKMQISARELEKKNIRILEDNWNKLKEHFKFLKINSTGCNKEFMEDIILLIQELEQGSDSNENN